MQKTLLIFLKNVKTFWPKLEKCCLKYCDFSWVIIINLLMQHPRQQLWYFITEISESIIVVLQCLNMFMWQSHSKDDYS